MEGFTLNIGWEYFLGILGGLIAIAWYTNGRFTALETSMEWVKDTLRELKISADNADNKAFSSLSPVNLTEIGEQWITESGLKDYIERNKDFYIENCAEKKDTNPYEVQKHIFSLFDEVTFEPAFEDKLKKFAFDHGTTMAVLRRIGGIYLRNICLASFGMNTEDIDRHSPGLPGVTH
jgi:hypothetical protein